MPTHGEIVAQVRDALAITLPSLDTAVGTPTRKIIDAIAEPIAESSIDRRLMDYQYDVDALTADALDAFVESMGMTRFAARRASGTVIFARSAGSANLIPIPQGTQVADESIPPNVFQTTLSAQLPAGDTSVEIPVTAVLGGSVGNVLADTISRVVSALGGITSVSNPETLTGGADAETDQQLRDRWKRTGLRNMAGTEAQMVGVALEHPAVQRVNVVGASKRRFEQIEVDTGAAESTVVDAKFVFPDSETVGPDITGGAILTPVTHYTFDDTVVPPTITVVDDVVMPDGIYELDFEYLPLASRNDPDNNISGKVDMFIDGVDLVEAIESLLFTNAVTFNNSGTGLYDKDDWVRENTGATPTAGNTFHNLGFRPVASLPASMIIASVTYDLGTHYWPVNRIANDGMAARSLSGIEWLAATHPAYDSSFAVTYIYNAAPRAVEIALRGWRLTNQDLMVHQALFQRLRVNLVVAYRAGVDPSEMESAVEDRLNRFVSSLQADQVLQISDLLTEVHLVPGVDAVRLATETDSGSAFAVQRVNSAGTVLETYEDGGTPGRGVDVYFADNEVPVLHDVTFDVRAQNTFGTGA